jgi:hypothetical protein
MEEKYCQSCGMPMANGDELYGTEQDGSLSSDYCKYCFQAGAFTFEGSMEDMIVICVPHMVEANPNMTEEEARNMMQGFFPMLKRWSKG